MKLILLLLRLCAATEPADVGEEELDLSNVLGLEPSESPEATSLAPAPLEIPEVPEIQDLEHEEVKEVTAQLAPASDDEIQSLERSVLKLANEGASPGMSTFLEELGRLVEEKMMKELRAQHAATQSQLAALYQEISTCASREFRETMNVQLKHDVPSELTAEAYGLPKLAERHRSCRTRQQRRLLKLRELQRRLQDLQAQKAELCEAYGRQEFNRTLPVGDSSSCVMDTTKYPVTSKTRHMDFLRDQLEWWETRLQAIQLAGARCHNATQDFSNHTPVVWEAKTAADDAKKSCDEAQVQMDQAACRLRSAQEKKCELIATCTESTWKLYSERLTAARKEEDFLQAQMRALLRIQCYLGAFQLSDMSKGILECKGKDFQGRDEVTNLSFLGKPKPALSECSLDRANSAGFCAYEGIYYANTFGLRVECTASCCKDSCES